MIKLGVIVQKLTTSSLFKSSWIYIFTNILNAAVPFLFLPILTRVLSPRDYGVIAISQVLMALLGPILGLSAQGAITRQYYERDRIDIGRYVSTCITLLIATTTLLAGFLLVCADTISAWLSFPPTWLWGVLFATAIQVLGFFALAMWRVQSKAWVYGGFQLGQTVLNIALSLWLIFGLKWGWEGRVAGQLISATLFGFLGLRMLWLAGWVKWPYSREYLRHAISFGLPLCLHSIGSWLITMIDRIFINTMVGLEAAGIYLVGYQIGMIIGIVQTAFNNAWVPWFYDKLKRNRPGDKRNIVLITYGYNVVILTAAIALALISPWFLSFFVGKNFEGASQYVFWIALGYAFNGMYKMVTNYLFYTENTKILTVITLLAGILNVILSYVLIKLNGPIGAAQATAAAFLLSYLLTWFAVTRLHPMPWNPFKKQVDPPTYVNVPGGG